MFIMLRQQLRIRGACATILAFLVAGGCNSSTKQQETQWSRGTLKERWVEMPSDIGSSVRHGAFKSWYASGRMHERGQYADGEKQGTWTEWYDDTFATRLSQGAYVAGKRHGVWTCWHNPEHTLLHGDHRSGHSGIAQLNLEMPVLNIAGYSNGVAHGDWISWHVSGQMADSMYYVDGSLNGEVRVYN